jgi:hypothetical protein
MAKGDKTPAKRRPNGTPGHELGIAEYCYLGGTTWAIRLPTGHQAHVATGAVHGHPDHPDKPTWTIVEHPELMTPAGREAWEAWRAELANGIVNPTPAELPPITVDPSIDVGEHRPHPEGEKFGHVRHSHWHGYLKAGVLEEV